MHAVPAPGVVVWIRQRRWRVEHARRVGDVVRLDVADRDARLTFLAPFDRPIVRPIAARGRRVRRQHAAARLAGVLARRESPRAVLAAIDARLDLLPYQLEPAAAALAGVRRILIADEVGLGKTIQAGLLLAECARRQPAFRALVIAPAALRAQWQRELDARFGLACTVADRHALDAIARAGRFADNPWRHPGIWLTSVDYLRQPHVQDALPFLPWDVVVIDEAHGVCGVTDRRAACDDAAKRARVVVLLTATPHSGDDGRFARLLALGELAGEHAPPTVFRRTRAAVGLARERHVHWHRVSYTAAETRLLDALLAYERAVLRSASAGARDRACLLLSLLRKRALSSMHAFHVSIERRLAWIDRAARDAPLDWIQPSFLFNDDADEERGDDDVSGLTAETGLAVASERTWLRRLRTLAAAAERSDSRLERIAALLRRRDEPVVVFTEYVHSLEVLARRLSGERRTALLHGGLTTLERESALAHFLDGGANVLIATDVAGQGLNLHTRARWIANLDLPWNPTRLEQRIGRVDRIGQSRRVHATVLVSNHRAEAPILRRLNERAVRAGTAIDDVEGLSAPLSEQRIVEAVLANAGEVPAVSASPVVRATRAWRRPATAIARDVARRRVLASRWQGPARTSPRHFETTGLAAATTGRPGPVVFFLVPLIDDTGAVVEQRLLAIRLDAERAAAIADRDELARLLRGVAAMRLARRVERVAQLEEPRRAARVATDIAIADYLRAIERPECEPGLFARRPGRVSGARSFPGERSFFDDRLLAGHRASADHGPFADEGTSAAVQPFVALGDPVIVLIAGRGRRR